MRCPEKPVLGRSLRPGLSVLLILASFYVGCASLSSTRPESPASQTAPAAGAEDARVVIEPAPAVKAEAEPAESAGRSQAATAEEVGAASLCPEESGESHQTFPFDFIVVADTPYSKEEEERLVTRGKPAIAEASAEFVIHVGDFKRGDEACTDDLILKRHKQIENLHARVFYTPGDNEWTDCDRRPKIVDGKSVCESEAVSATETDCASRARCDSDAKAACSEVEAECAATAKAECASETEGVPRAECVCTAEAECAKTKAECASKAEAYCASTFEGFSELERLDFLREKFFDEPIADPLEEWDYADQPNFPENARWTVGAVMFVTVHYVSTNNGRVEILNSEDDIEAALALTEAREHANRVWVDKAFEKAKNTKPAAIVIATQADPTGADGAGACCCGHGMNCDAFERFRAQLRLRASKFSYNHGKTLLPVLLIHGDTNPYCWDRDFGGRAAPNLQRLNVWGDYQSPGDVTVISYDPLVDPLYVPFTAETLLEGKIPSPTCDPGRKAPYERAPFGN